MSDLQNKFDRLPQDFDQEALWRRIERPKKKRRFAGWLWFGVGIVGASIFFFAQRFAPSEEHETIAHVESSKIDESKNNEFAKIGTASRTLSEDQLINREQISSSSSINNNKKLAKASNHISSSQKNNVPLNKKNNDVLIKKAPTKNSIKIEKPIKSHSSESSNKIKRTTQQTFTELNQADNSQIQLPNESRVLENKNPSNGSERSMQFIEAPTQSTDQNVFKQQNEILKPIQILKLDEVKFEPVDILPDEAPVISIIEHKRIGSNKNRLMVTFGLGRTQHKFERDGISYERDLSIEEADTDYTMGLQYSRNVGQFDIFSQLQFRQINTSFSRQNFDETVNILPASVRTTRTSTTYQINNEQRIYQLNLGLKKSIPIGSFEGHLAAGVGLVLAQQSSASYLTSEFESKNLEMSSASFEKSVHGILDLGISRRLNSKWLVTAGAQYHSPLLLGVDLENTEHKVQSVSIYLGIGKAF